MARARFDHLHLAVEDIARSKHFYVTHFGADVLARYSWRDVHSVALKIGSVRVNIRSGLTDGGHALDHFGLHLPNLAATYESLERAHVDVQREPRPWAPDVIHEAVPEFNLGAEFAFVKGPDGELIELVQRT